MACAPAMTFHIGRGERPTRLLLRGDSEGQVVVWTLPEVSERQMKLVRQESFDRLPGEYISYLLREGERPIRLLLKGDSEGQVVVWTLPEVSERQMKLVRQESFDRLPG